MKNRRFYIRDKLISGCANIIDYEAYHISKVLKMKVGDIVRVFNKNGVECYAKLVKFYYNKIDIKILGRVEEIKESPILITFAQAFLREKKMSYLVRHLTELGISRWIPYVAKRSVSIPNKSSLNSKLKRWKRISIESAKQNGRNFFPNITFISNFYNVLELSKMHDLNIIFWENSLSDFKILENINCNKIKKIMIMVGPEGGFELDEIKSAVKNNFILTKIGPRILRVETASIVACSILQYIFGDIVKKT